MPYVGELPELVINSKTQSPAKIQEILKSQGYDITSTEEQTDEAQPPEPSAETHPETPAVETPAAQPEAEQVEEGEQPPAPAVHEEHKKPTGAQRYKKQRDEAKAAAEQLRIDNARKDGELDALRRQLEARGTKAPEEPQVVPPAPVAAPELPPQLTLPARPELTLPELTEPDINDPGIEGDFDKWQEATKKVRKEWQKAMADAQQENAQKIYDWNEETKEAKRAHTKAIADRAEAVTRTAAETEQQARQRVFDDILADGAQRYSDWDVIRKEHLDDKGQPKRVVNGTMHAVIHDIGLEDKQAAADLYHWIATHPDEAHTLAMSTLLPSDTDVKAVNPPAKAQEAARKMMIKLNRIAASITPPTPKPPTAGAPEVPEPEDEPIEEEETPAPPAVAPPVPVKPEPTPAPSSSVPPAPAPKAGPKPPVKPSPINPVGSRTSAGYKRLKDMSQAEVAKLHPDDYRKRWESGEYN